MGRKREGREAEKGNVKRGMEIEVGERGKGIGEKKIEMEGERGEERRGKEKRKEGREEVENG